MEDMLKEVKEKYKRVGFTDTQMAIAISKGISPVELLKIKEACEQIGKTFNEILESIEMAIRNIITSEPVEKLLNSLKSVYELQKQYINTPKNKKGKLMKPWEKNRYFK